MANASTKSELLEKSQKRFDEMWALIATLEPNAAFSEEMSAMGKEAHWGRDKNMRDVLIHLYEWHMLLLEWEKANASGEEKPFIPLPYNWKTYGDMNVAFWEKHQSTPYEMAVENLKDSHKRVMDVIEKYSEEEIFTKKYFKWTGTSCLQQYFIGAAARHYEWAMKKIKAQMKLANFAM